MRPIGIPDEDWTVGYNKTVEVDGLPLVATWGGATYTARATAAIGQLLLHRGNWEGKQLVNRTWALRATAAPGLGFWTRGLAGENGLSKSLPNDAFAGARPGM